MSLRLIIVALVLALLLPGTAAAATRLIGDDFEDGTLNAWVGSVANTNVTNFNAGSGAFSGSRVARGCWGDNFNIILRSTNAGITTSSELYLRYRIRYETGFDWSDPLNNNNKHVRFNTAATTNGFFYSLFNSVGPRGWLGDGSVINSGAAIPDQFGMTFTPDLNRWYLYEFFFKLNTGGLANGSGFVKVNGAINLSSSTVMYRTGDTVFYEELLFPGNNTGTTVAGRDCVQIDNAELWNGDPTADTTRPKSPTAVTAVTGG